MQTEIGERINKFRLHKLVRILQQKICLKLLYGKKDK